MKRESKYSNSSVISFQNQSKYDQGPAPTLKPRPAELAPAPTLTPAFTDAAPIEKPKLEAKPAPSTNGEPLSINWDFQYLQLI